jgi:hypothetical protein
MMLVTGYLTVCWVTNLTFNYKIMGPQRTYPQGPIPLLVEITLTVRMLFDLKAIALQVNLMGR